MSASISSAICRKIAAVRMSLMDFARRRHRSTRLRMFAIVSLDTTRKIACSYSRSRRTRHAQAFWRPSPWSHSLLQWRGSIVRGSAAPSPAAALVISWPKKCSILTRGRGGGRGFPLCTPSWQRRLWPVVEPSLHLLLRAPALAWPRLRPCAGMGGASLRVPQTASRSRLKLAVPATAGRPFALPSQYQPPKCT